LVRLTSAKARSGALFVAPFGYLSSLLPEVFRKMFGWLRLQRANLQSVARNQCIVRAKYSELPLGADIDARCRA